MPRMLVRWSQCRVPPVTVKVLKRLLPLSMRAIRRGSLFRYVAAQVSGAACSA
jgi:hypothetical protein